MSTIPINEKKMKLWITIISIVIPVVVAILFRVKIPNSEPLSFLPPIYATINGLTALVLIAAVIAVKNKNQKLHAQLMSTAVLLSLSFLVMYVAYHMTSDSTSFGGEGFIKYVYYIILITHILLSIIIIPLVLRTYMFGYLGKLEQHRKIAKFTFPIWLYVAITGVVVFVMISPYYK